MKNIKKIIMSITLLTNNNLREGGNINLTCQKLFFET